MRRRALACAALVTWGCVFEQESPAPAGNGVVVNDASSNAFSLPFPGLTGDSLDKHRDGDAAFEATFVTPPAPVNAGLGPVFNNTSCVSCHGRDGRGRPPYPGETFSSMLFRASIPGADAHGGPLPAPGFGGQIQLRAIFGQQPEAAMAVSYSDSLVVLEDGSTVTLRVPAYSVLSSYVPMPAGTLFSPRVAPPVFGLGLLESVPESEILSKADENDADGDGISGRANTVWDKAAGKAVLGRFGWKANTPNLRQQSAAAYNNDMGVTSWLFPEETCAGQTQTGCDNHAPDVDSAVLEAASFYVRTLAAPARRDVQAPAVKRGEAVFNEIGCQNCHVRSLGTSSAPGLSGAPGPRIEPFTDLLVHDLGEGLADGRPDFRADGREWRTAPLWGIGLTEVVNGHSFFLHDGRARGLLEAVLWHGGEAAKAQAAARKLSKGDREALLAFLASL